tara:strand:- start:73 stop:3051 length:2979 start_codon:yes stop_codon:yes gene_type:complete
MASITQTIPNYVNGISEQPDELKTPGQLKVAKNVLPDVTQGLTKRPGGKLIGGNLGAYTTDSKWFHYYRDENEQYIGQIQLSDGELKMWRCDTGAPVTVNYESSQATELKNYLKQTNSGGTIVDSDLQTLTLNDFTYINNRNKTVAMQALASGDNDTSPPQAYIELKKIAYANQYSVNLFDDTSTEEVYTATRLKVDRDIDSSNSCQSANPDVFAPSGTQPNTGVYTGECLNTDNKHEDGYCPNVATEIFSIDHGTAIDSSDINGVTGQTVSVTPVSGSGAAATRKNLYFRITTTGQAVGESDDETPIYRCRYTTTIDLLYGGEGWRTNDWFYVWMKNARYKITITSHNVSKVQANRGLIRPEPTSFDTKTVVTAESILGSIRTEIDNDAGANFDDVQQIGNGLYITRSSGSFNISTPVGDLLNVLSDSVEDIADLPKQCKNGYVVKVANSEADEDDYYVKFIGDNGRDGNGVWEECVKPGDQINYDPATMPIQLKRESNGTFTVKQVTWDPALVGDTATDGTNPRASFVGKAINKMVFFRNRLVMLSDEYVIMSRPGDFFNFWAKSAITYTASDMIDISCSSEQPAVVYDGVQVNSGLVLFTKNQQFMLTTDSDVLSPLTAKINALASYNFNFKTNPVSLGTTLAFLDNAGKYNRFWEMTAVLREGEPNVLEQSKSISKSFDSDLDMIANSRENQVIFFGKKGTKKLYGFRYHTTSAERIQQAWFNWELSGEIQHIAMLDDALFAIIKDGTKYTMQRFSIRGLAGTIYVTDDQGTTTDTADDISYRVHLDNALVITNSQLGYSSSTTRTGFTLPDSFNASSSNQLAVFCHTVGDNNGKYAEASIVGNPGDYNIEFPGNWIGQDITVGYLYDMEVQFPKIYVQQQSDGQFKSDLHSSLVIHRIKFSFGPQGLYTTTLTRLGKPSYTQIHESPQLDTYTTDDVAVNPVSVHTVPVYEKNTNLTLNLKSTHPTPATLYSMTWEGDYTPKYYKSV